jgi:hypothetical protein
MGVAGPAGERQRRRGEEARHEVDGDLISLSEIEVTSGGHPTSICDVQ